MLTWSLERGHNFGNSKRRCVPRVRSRGPRGDDLHSGAAAYATFPVFAVPLPTGRPEQAWRGRRRRVGWARASACGVGMAIGEVPVPVPVYGPGLPVPGPGAGGIGIVRATTGKRDGTAPGPGPVATGPYRYRTAGGVVYLYLGTTHCNGHACCVCLRHETRLSSDERRERTAHAPRVGGRRSHDSGQVRRDQRMSLAH